MEVGNRITDNALTADSGEALIAKALADIQRDTSWRVVDADAFADNKSVYYDSAKVGSFFVEVQNTEGVLAVLKIQLRSLPLDEGSIIRHIATHDDSSIIRTPEIYADSAWNEKDGYGYLILEHLGHLPNLWRDVPPQTDADFAQHKEFLVEYIRHVLPIEPLIPKPGIDYLVATKESFQHFQAIADASRHHHIAKEEVERYKEQYFQALEKVTMVDMHFGHGHLTGLDVKVDADNSQFIVLANLYWKWIPLYQEVAFPIWNSIMHTRNPDITFDDFLVVVHRWGALWSSGIYANNPTTDQFYWANLLKLSVQTIMLDLGASEWKSGEEKAKQALLDCWKAFFDWLIKHKFS